MNQMVLTGKVYLSKCKSMVSFKKLRQIVEVQGNGNIVAREINVSSFLRLHLGLNCTVELLQSDEEKVVVVTDENLQEYFEARNSGRTLYVAADAKLRKPVYTSCKVQVDIRQLDTLYIRNEKGDVICPEELSLSNPLSIKIQSVANIQLAVNSPSVKILSQCVGNFEIKGKCGMAEIKNQSVGNFDASGLKAETLTIKNMGEGNIDLFAEKEISISHYGVGYIHFRGDAVLKDVKQHGVGEIKHVNN